MKGISAVSYHATNRSLGEGLLCRAQHPVPVTWTQVVRPHIAELNCTNPRYISEFRNGIKKLVRVEPCGHRSRGIVDLAGYRSSRVNQVHQGQRFVLSHLGYDWLS